MHGNDTELYYFLRVRDYKKIKLVKNHARRKKYFELANELMIKLQILYAKRTNT